jgi:anhydro-N-acetylmuramic acid kinase
VFGQKDATVAVLNLGGIANLSVLPADPKAPVLGFDCGPANALLDAWCERHTGAPFDAAGSWGAGGHCLPDLLNLLRSEPYFAQPPPKSTGRDLFSMAWLEKKLHSHLDAPPKDIQKTLIKLTSSTCADCVRSYAKDSKILIICGGGAYNEALMQNLQDDLPDLQIGSSAQHGLPPLQVEAAAFAWLARQTILRQPGNLPSATGAAGPRILGAIYPA